MTGISRRQMRTDRPGFRRLDAIGRFPDAVRRRAGEDGLVQASETVSSAAPSLPSRSEELSVVRTATVSAFAAIGLLALLALPLVALSFGWRSPELQSAFVAAFTIAPLLGLVVVWLTDGLDERAWRNRASRLS
jgi:hypothetical protein